MLRHLPAAGQRGDIIVVVAIAGATAQSEGPVNEVGADDDSEGAVESDSDDAEVDDDPVE